MTIEKRSNVVLSVETATRSGSLAILRDNAIIALWSGTETTSHSSRLLIEIDELLQQARVDLADVSFLTTAIGPGSFTGLRVGLATIKGLAAVTKIPVIGVPTLTALSESVRDQTLICSMLPAGRGEIFAQLFLRDKSFMVQPLGNIKTAPVGEVLNSLKDKAVLNLIAPPEKIEEINSFIVQNKLNQWLIHLAPANLATNVAQVAAQQTANFSSNYFSKDLQLIYGREADVGK